MEIKCLDEKIAIMACYFANKEFDEKDIFLRWMYSWPEDLTDHDGMRLQYYNRHIVHFFHRRGVKPKTTIAIEWDNTFSKIFKEIIDMVAEYDKSELVAYRRKFDREYLPDRIKRLAAEMRIGIQYTQYPYEPYKLSGYRLIDQTKKKTAIAGNSYDLTADEVIDFILKKRDEYVWNEKSM